MTAPSTPDVQIICSAYAKILAESHPCNAAAALERAIDLINDLANERDLFQERNKELFTKIVLDSVPQKEESETAPTTAPLLPDAFKMHLLPKLTMPPAPHQTAPTIWWERPDEHPYDKVTLVRDAEGDFWKPLNEGEPDGRWGLCSTCNMETHYWRNVPDFGTLVANYGPIVDVSPGAITGAWFTDDELGSDFQPPPGIRFVATPDGTFEFTRVFQNKWRRTDQTADDVKIDGYWTFSEILEEHENVFAKPRGQTFTPLRFEVGEGPPDNIIDKVMTPAGFYWKRQSDGWVCPGPNGVAHQLATFGEARVSWDDLLNKYQNLVEHWND